MTPIVVGVAGGTGSGKTTVAQAIIRSLGRERVAYLQHDSYYRDRSHLSPKERQSINYDHPDALETSLLVEHLTALKAGRPVQVPVYDFTEHVRRPATVTVEPRPVVVLDGILILAESGVRELLDLRVFVDTDPDLRFIRRLDRDLRERGRDFDSVVRQYLQSVRPMHLEFAEPSKRYAEMIIPEGGYNKPAVDMLITRVSGLMGGEG
jgi:uridine kinase